MKQVTFEDIKKGVSDGLFNACHVLNDFTVCHLKEAHKNESDELSKEILKQIIDNQELARTSNIPMCQDTGIVTVFAKVGYDLRLDCNLYDAINAGVKDAYEKYYLRKSVADPLTRINTKDNTPAIVHVDMVSGDSLTLYIAPKGAGSENMSKLKMLNPTDGEQGIINFVLDTIKEAGGRPCPPLFLGIGIGGNFETCALMAKEALLREECSSDKKINELEKIIKDEVNKLNIGPMGLGGKCTCMDVFINACPCHIASLPVAVNIQCHANRHVKVVL